MQTLYHTDNIELSIVMPCLNEELTIGTCIRKANYFLERSNVSGEIVIADNGSTDASVDIAKALGARVVHVADKGYGNAIKGGIAASRGQYIIMGDADDSYDFSNLTAYVYKLRQGYDLVMGNRFKGGIKDGAMPFLHKYLGNPVLSFIGKTFFNIPHINDFHCGLRGFNKKSVRYMNLRSSGMEFASEMVVKAALMKMDMIEIPTSLHPDGRNRPPHLNTWRDGWRHLCLMLNFCPRSYFYFPLIVFVMLAASVSFLLAPVSYPSIISELYSNRWAISGGIFLLILDGILFCYITSTQALRAQLKPKWRNLSKAMFRSEF